MSGFKEKKEWSLSSGSGVKPKNVLLAAPIPSPSVVEVVDTCYELFIMEGSVSLGRKPLGSLLKMSGCSSDILRDAQSFILEGTLPLSDQSFCGVYALCRGFGPEYFKVPLNFLYFKSDLVDGMIKADV